MRQHLSTLTSSNKQQACKLNILFVTSIIIIANSSLSGCYPDCWDPPIEYILDYVSWSPTDENVNIGVHHARSQCEENNPPPWSTISYRFSTDISKFVVDIADFDEETRATLPNSSTPLFTGPKSTAGCNECELNLNVPNTTISLLIALKESHGQTEGTVSEAPYMLKLTVFSSAEVHNVYAIVGANVTIEK